MDEETCRIHDLIGKLSEAFWDPIERDPSNWVERVVGSSLVPQESATEAESKAWRELTDPQNLEAFSHYLAYWSDVELDEEARRFHQSIREKIERRLEAERRDTSD